MPIEQHVITLLRKCKIASSEQIARLFAGYAHPQKAATKFMRELILDRWVETKEMRTGTRSMTEPHLYRLTKKGRLATGGDFHPTPFESLKVNHWLGLGSIYLDMLAVEPPVLFETEIRDQCTYYGKTYRVSPDIFAVWKGRALFIEYQRSRLSRANWRRKWEPLFAYYSSGQFLKGEWQLAKPVKPRLVAVTEQPSETVACVPDFPIEVVQSIAELIDVFEAREVMNK